MSTYRTNNAAIVEDFHRARRHAALEQLFARLTGQSTELLSYEDVRQMLRAKRSSREELKEIPLDAIVGSVGRYADFTRSFLPKQDNIQRRWVRVKQAVTSLEGVPPIRVYQIGEVYFVLDGNHRVSVARELGASYIEAYVTKLETKVPLSPDDEPDDLVLKAEYADFLERTHLDELRPQADLSATVPGQYHALAEHIEVHRHFMGLEQQREIPYQEAVTHWYDKVYMPVVHLIRRQGILKEFPDRTETDLYLWLADHRAELARELGWDVRPEAAAADLAARSRAKGAGAIARLGTRILEAVTPDGLETGPDVGKWRTEHLAARRDDLLFIDVLVPVSGEEAGWQALEQALAVARREGSRLHGLHVVASEEAQSSAATLAVQDEFNQRCEAAGIEGNLILAVGKVPREICRWSRWTDLVTVNLTYPPPPKPLARLSSGFRTLLWNCPPPIMTVPGAATDLNRALLAYDRSPKAREALFVATYLVNRWEIPLTVVAVEEKGVDAAESLARAQTYLEDYGARASYLQAEPPVAEAILRAAETHQSDLILMGGYGRSPVVEVVLGGVVDQVLRESRTPMLICR
jgi:nucleotide-binding universal stress UspA family protein